MIRKPAVAGQFYKADEKSLQEEVKSCLNLNLHKQDAIAIVVPHAGYIYSGKVAGAVYSSVNLPKVFVILSPNHNRLGSDGAVMSQGGWETPLGIANINQDLAQAILKKSSNLFDDSFAHSREHSLEVQLPFLQFLVPDFTFVPISLYIKQLFRLQEIGSAIAQAISESKEKIIMIASTDMTHFEDQKSAESKDKLAIDQILALDPEGLHKTVSENNISMCGVDSTVAVLYAAKELGASNAELIKYSTSGMITRNFYDVVGYAGLVIS